MGILIIVKHSLPEMIRNVPARQWYLLKSGRPLSKTLAEKLSCYTPNYIVSSSEPKAIETTPTVANHLYQTFHVAKGMHEHDRSNVD